MYYEKISSQSSVRIINFLSRALIHLGLAPRHTYLITVQGRKSGKLYSTPVTLVENESGRWLVAPNGEVNWVRNARAMGQVTLTRAGHSESFAIAEVEAEESASVLKRYLTLEPITRPYFAAKFDSPANAFQTEAARHPVFRLRALTKEE